jgi:hypothetical protein
VTVEPLELGLGRAAAAERARAAYSGYLERDPLVAELNILLEAERAGARVAARLLSEAKRPELKDLARAIQRDEARWCRMLMGALHALEATPSQLVGRFYEQAMAIAEIEARFAFVNRGQAWVVGRLKALLPRVRDDRLHADLLRMLAAHDHNITQAQAALAAAGRGRLGPSARAPQAEA